MTFNFVGKRRIWFTISGALLALAVGALLFNVFVRGHVMNFGIDFTGGTMVTLRFPAMVSVADVRETLEKHGLGKSIIQRSGKQDIYIRTEEIESGLRAKIVDELKEKYGDVELLEADTIGPVIGKELRTQALWALFVASLGIILYVSFRFEFKYAVAALLALYHDAIITTGIIALLWRDIEIQFIAAILTIMGYSINDSIVIFDRIRENIKKLGGKKMKLSEIINISIAETMARSINTVLTTVIIVIAVLFFGGETLKDFALTLLIGFVVGAYSSIFVASPIIAVWESRK
ncbi:protein-export membrane protein SecF [candidate division WOR-1 bacterium RIFOXYB2_FULL_42_35]|uniref:Protein-export membrane protein SecF n=1 Tax=candidate division WOR-1 bacterium RIFOXYC2_FULL_41_25 TaxID=1802586 RepID=A0A1F4TKV1_UNCSA|nr:MAG: protein-export membrane protein SecF [candidate division WOR-1 bacterium RIFOXYA2_FULL_41_14]OGC21786.1 MAG: protein-export membrane protein SecF [candidate division WOR-1 bacterium RIFOXYB2_FULL_42_35]OGC32683.1 MAG: protein-export membrane protein SecF [candidate division WOR-1 bacterium RIFOXYC2_FULL_41_25]OGC41556.1 MAG: protein-export membrane protein SecF [candidate division WOR-1 bacterium RIFOXYD2_FULL_41_8]